MYYWNIFFLYISILFSRTAYKKRKHLFTWCFISFFLQSTEISLHIRVVGQWTKKLFEYFESEQRRLECTMQGEFCQVEQKIYKFSGNSFPTKFRSESIRRFLKSFNWWKMILHGQGVNFTNILSACFVQKCFFCQNITREKLRKALSFEECAIKMLVKLTQGQSHVEIL